MRLLVGTSGYSYKEWRGNFYPEGLSPAEMLHHYATRLPAVEINNTFYRLPKAQVVQSWASQVPESFRFVIKASRRITHMKRLKNAESESEYLYQTVAGLEARLGALLFQLPPYLQKDVERLDRFAGAVPQAFRAAFEFRHPSWRDAEVLRCLENHGFAWCTADGEDGGDGELVRTAPYGYIRLRRERYSEEDLTAWLARLRSLAWEEAFVFFKDEEEGWGPRFAETLLRLAGAS